MIYEFVPKQAVSVLAFLIALIVVQGMAESALNKVLCACLLDFLRRQYLD